MNSKWSRLLIACALTALIAVLVAACGGGSSSSSEESTSATESAESEPAASGEEGSATGGEELSGEGSLVIGGWGGTIDKATQIHYIDPYQEDGGQSSITFVDAPSAQLARVAAQNQAGDIEWDMVDSAPGENAYQMNAQGLLAPLPAELKSELEETLGKQKVTEFGFTHANVGHVIVCNMDKMKTCPESMAEFFDTEKFPQTRTMGSATPLVTVTAAEEAAGMEASETATTPVDVDSAMEQLEHVRPDVKVFFESGDQLLQIMRSGEAEMALALSGRAYTLEEEGMNLQVNWNQAVYEPSFWTVVKGGPNEKGAFEFMKWIANHPQNQAEWGEELNYSVPNPEAFDFFSPEQAKKQADYPANFKLMAEPNWQWLTEGKNAEELNTRYQEFLRG